MKRAKAEGGEASASTSDLMVLLAKQRQQLIEELAQDLSSLQEEALIKEEQIATLGLAAAERLNLLQDVESAAASLRQQLEVQARQLQEKEREIETLSSAVDGIRSIAEEREALLKAQASELRSRERELAEKNHALTPSMIDAWLLVLRKHRARIDHLVSLNRRGPHNAGGRANQSPATDVDDVITNLRADLVRLIAEMTRVRGKY